MIFKRCPKVMDQKTGTTIMVTMVKAEGRDVLTLSEGSSPHCRNIDNFSTHILVSLSFPYVTYKNLWKIKDEKHADKK